MEEMNMEEMNMEELTEEQWADLREAERIAYAPTLVSDEDDDLPF